MTSADQRPRRARAVPPAEAEPAAPAPSIRPAPPGRPSLRAALAQRVIVADGAMGSMLQGSAATRADFFRSRASGETDVVGFQLVTVGPRISEATAELFAKNAYRGCRYAFGYPACPDLEDRAKVMRLPGAERIGVTLPEEFQLAPEQPTDALIVHHPEAKYFSA